MNPAEKPALTIPSAPEYILDNFERTDRIAVLVLVPHACAPSVLAPDIWTLYTLVRVRLPQGDSPSRREFGDCSCPTWVCEAQLSTYLRSFRIPCGTNGKIASRRKRWSDVDSWANSGGRNLRATVRWRRVSSALKTTPIPPPPSFSKIR